MKLNALEEAKQLYARLQQGAQNVGNQIQSGFQSVGKTLANKPITNIPGLNFTPAQAPRVIQQIPQRIQPVLQKVSQVRPGAVLLSGLPGGNNVNAGLKAINLQPPTFQQIGQNIVNTYGPAAPQLTHAQVVNLTPQQKQNLDQQQFHKTFNMVANIGGGSEDVNKATKYLRDKLDPSSARQVMDFVAHVQTKGAKAMYEDSPIIQSIANDLFGKRSANWSNQKLANVFDLILGKLGRGKNIAGIGLSVGDIRANSRTGTSIPLTANLKKGEQLATQTGEEQIAQTGIASNVSNDSQNMASLKTTQTGSIAQNVSNPQDPYFNVNRLNIDDKGKQIVKQTIQEVKPQVEKVVGKKLSNAEVVNTANNSAKIIRNAIGEQSTKEYEAALLKTRQKLAAMAQSGTVDKDFLDTLIAVKSHATNAGRVLQSLSISADPKLVTAKSAIIEAVTKVEKDSNKILDAAKGVDFNDYNQATAFYRKFIKPKASEWIDTLRYNSMLSSPNTHINNAFSNLVNTAVVAPVEKTITGTLDFLNPVRRIQGKPQAQFAREGLSYAKGYAQSLGEASHAFADSIREKTVSGNLDTRNIPLATKGVKGGIEKVLTLPTKLLEASDQFFTKLTEGGEKAALQVRKNKGIAVGNVESQASQNAAYRLFRSELGDEKQGVLLDGIDKVTGLIQQARTSSNALVSNVAKFTLPFVRTPMNILKQGIEYSPAGVLTLPGAANKTEQLSKMIIGSSAAAATALLATSGRTTWAEPTDEKAKQTFRAAGMQPYSVKIGDKWISYAKLPPAISFNIALVAAIHDAQENKSLEDSQVQKILEGVAKWGNFFADQSYLKNIGDFIAAAKGDTTAISSAISNYPQQIVPFRAMLGWIARTLDPYQRKVDPGEDFIHKQIDQLKMQIPGLSQQVTPRLDERGNPILNQNKIANAISPLRVTTENPEGKARYILRDTELKANAYVKPFTKAVDSQVQKVANPITTDLFNQVVQGEPMSEDIKQEIYKRISTKVNTKVKKAVLQMRAKDIKGLIDNIPDSSAQGLRIYLNTLKSNGLLNKDVISSFSTL